MRRILTILILFIAVYTNGQPNFFWSHNNPCYTIGQSLNGGKVAYIYQPGDIGYVAGQCHGIIASNSDFDDVFDWDVPRTIGTTSTDLGEGTNNTNEIIAIQGDIENYAARSCYNLVEGGYSDWVLPSLAELGKLYANKTLIGGFTDTAYYWSSSEQSISGAWSVKFDTGSTPLDKNTIAKVRAIRYF